MSNLHQKDELKSLNGKTIVITGASGMLGLAFQEMIDLLLDDVNLHAFSREQLDVADEFQVGKIIEINPDIIIHCAAIVNADYCESHRDEAVLVQINGMEYVVEAAKACGAKVFYPQSFLIYDGKEMPITESTSPNPLGVYGELKYLAETRLLNELPESLVVRMAGFFGGRDKDKNFVGKIVPHIANLISEEIKSIEIGDRVWQPTYTNDLAFNSLLLLANNKKGVYCMASHGEASFYELTCLIAKELGIDKDLAIHKVSAEAVSGSEAARRPEKAIIENQRLKAEGLDRQRVWQESVKEYLNQNYFKKVFSRR